jgi:hypothetical protein
MSQDEATEDEVTIHRVEPSENAEEDFSPFDDLGDEYNPGPIIKVEASDGMPTQYVPDTESDIPVLNPETLVCMGVFDEFVLRGPRGEIVQRWKPEEVTRSPNGTWYVPKTDLNDVARALFRPAEPMPVEPIRPPCQHYVRQATQFDYNPQAKAFARLCSARRTTEGTFMSVGNRGMYACDMRYPRDLASEKMLDDFDKKKIEQGKKRVYLPIKAGS